MRTITLEEHFATPAFLRGPGASLTAVANRPGVGAEVQTLFARLSDLGDGRVAAMDEARIDVQALSLTAPGVEQLNGPEAVALAREVNDALAAAVAAHPDRLRGFATVPTPDPAAAVEELRRAHDELGFRGAVINGHAGGRYLDDERFWPVLAEAERQAMPIYLHPTPPPPPIAAAYAGNYSPTVAAAFSTGGWGWHVETGYHVLRLILSGAFDRFPDLQVVIGHLGEGLPAFFERSTTAFPREMTQLERPVVDYLRRNLHYTVAGFNAVPPFLSLLLGVGADRIMFSADWPYRDMAEARAFLDRLPVSPADREKIAHRNAEQLYGF